MVKNRDLSKKVLASLLTMSYVYLGGTCMLPMAEAEELTDKTYTGSMASISSGNYTVSAGDVTIDASGYTGIANYQYPLFKTMNGNINVDIAAGKTLTVKGFNGKGDTSPANNKLNGVEPATLYAYNRFPAGTDIAMTFTGGNIVVSNEYKSNSKVNVYGLFANNDGKFVFKNDGDNKINLTVLMPEVQTAQHRYGIGLHKGSFNFNGGNLKIDVPNDPGATSIDRRVGIVMSGGSDLDIKADNIFINANELAFQLTQRCGDMNNQAITGVTNTAKFDADSIIFKGASGIRAAINSDSRNKIEFNGAGKTEIYAIIPSTVNETNFFGEIIGGKAVEIDYTDLTFNNDAVLVGENLTAQGTAAGHWVNPGTQFEKWQDGYWLKTVSAGSESALTANKDISILSNGGYYNTALHVWGKSQAEFNGKTSITVQNGVDTARAVYVYDNWDGTTKANFKDDLMISTAGSNASYLYGIDVRAGGKVDVAKGLIMNDNDNLTWSLFSMGNDSKIAVNSAATGEVQVVGEVGGYDGGTIDMTMNTATSYLTAASYLSGDGKVNLDISKQAVWNMTGTSKATALNLNSGAAIDMRADNNAYSTLTAENMQGSGGIIKQDIDVRTMESDKVFVTGDFNGTQALDIYQKDDYVPAGDSTEGTGLVLASVNGNGTFTAKDREGTLFYTHYDLANKASETAGFATDWYLNKVIKTNETTTSVDTVLAANALNYHTWRTENDKLLQRMGELRHNGEEEQGVWFRVKGSKIGRDGKFGFENKYTAYELGYDQVMKKTADKTRYQGAAISYTDGSSSYSKGSGDNSSKSISFYNTEIGSKGHYLDLVFKISNMDNDFTVYDTNSNKITGDFNNIGVSLSAEYGRKNDLSGGWYIEPQAQFTLGYLGGDSYTTSNGINVYQSGIKSAVGRIGFNIGKEVGNKGIVYAKANLLHEFGGGYDVTMTDSTGHVKVSDSFNDTWFEYGVGAAFATGKSSHLYFDVERSTGSDFTKDWQWNVGARWNF